MKGKTVCFSERRKSMDNVASSYRRYLDGDDTGIVEIIKVYKDGLTLYIPEKINCIENLGFIPSETYRTEFGYHEYNI